jgi:galactokinase
MATTATATAPGRLDLMGGVADYSGSLVLQVATAALTTATLTCAPTPPGGEDALALSTEARVGGGPAAPLPLAWLRAWCAADAGAPLAARLAAVRAHLQGLGVPRWVFYAFGSLAAFCGETGWAPPAGHSLALAIASRVPLSQGVSSSASIEVAVLRALRGAALPGGGSGAGARLGDLRLAHVAQHTENHVVGAPCGLMDQLASSLGAAGRVLPILCRPDAVEPLVALPQGVLVVGWPSGAEHELGGASPYAVARAASFMAKRALGALLPQQPLGHLAQLQPSHLAAVAARLPEAMTGREFLAAHGGVDDALSAIDPEQVYALRAGAEFPVGENFRCVALSGRWGAERRAAQAFFPGVPLSFFPPTHGRCSAGRHLAHIFYLTRTAPRILHPSPPPPTSRCATALALLRSLPGQSEAATEATLALVGELMRQSHRGYTSIGLGAPELDQMLEALDAEVGLAGGVYGARISGGGSGGTMAILCHERALPAITALATRLTFGKPFPGLIT